MADDHISEMIEGDKIQSAINALENYKEWVNKSVFDYSEKSVPKDLFNSSIGMFIKSYEDLL